jgi:hypothetical protein
MVTNYETKKLKLNTGLRGFKAGNVIPVKVDKDGTCVDPYWRARVKDSARDKCVEFVEKKKTTSTKKTEVNKDAD